MSNNDFGTNLTANRKPSISEVDTLAGDLAARYCNKNFRPWYCHVVNVLGVARVHEIMERVEGTNNPGKLFSRLAADELKQRANKQRLQALKDGAGFGR